MGGRRRLKGGAERLLGRHDHADGRAFRRCFDALDTELGPFRSRLLQLEASRVSAAWVNLMAATRALAEARRHRQTGRGRRPSARMLERLARRHGLADATYTQALERLRELARRTGRPVPSPLEIMAAALEGRDG